MIKASEVKKNNSKCVAKTVLDNIENISEEEIINGLFYNTDNEVIRELVSGFEKLMLIAKMNPGKFTPEMLKFFKKTQKYIKDNNAYREYSKFAYDMHLMMKTKNVNVDIMSLYLSLLMECRTYLENDGKTICGVTKSGNPIEIDEMYYKIEYGLIEYMEMLKKNKKAKYSFDSLRKYFRKYGYEIKTNEEYVRKGFDQQLATNMLFDMTYLIDEDYLDIVPQPCYLASGGFNQKIRKKYSVLVYMEMLKRRTTMLPLDGVNVKVLFKDTPVKEVLIKEKFVENRFIMLYKAKMYDDTYISGFYDIENEFFENIWSDTKNLKGDIFSSEIENFIMEIYATLTTDMEIDNKDDFEFVINKKKGSSDNQGDSVRLFDKNNYYQTETTVRPYKRKLPAGAKASEEAKLQAQRFGYVLRDDETFVSEFTKTVHKTTI